MLNVECVVIVHGEEGGKHLREMEAADVETLFL